MISKYAKTTGPLWYTSGLNSSKINSMKFSEKGKKDPKGDLGKGEVDVKGLGLT